MIQTIEFTGKLREPQMKTIEVSNNSYQAMQYVVVQSGSLDFKLELKDNELYLKEKVIYKNTYNNILEIKDKFNIY